MFPEAEVESLPPDTPPTVHRVHRRPFGMHPVSLLSAVAALALVIGIVLIAGPSLGGGLIFLAVSLGSLTLLSLVVRRDPEAPASRRTVRAADRTASLARLSAVTARAWARAGLELVHIRSRQLRLRRQLEKRLQPLGEAVYRGDEGRAEVLKQQAAELEEKLHEQDRDAAAVLAAARRAIEQEHVGVEPTRSHPIPPTDARPG